RPASRVEGESSFGAARSANQPVQLWRWSPAACRFFPRRSAPMLITRVEPSGVCVFCNKEREVAAVVIDGQQEVLLCWSDIKKHAQMRMRMNGFSDSEGSLKATDQVMVTSK